MWKNESHQKVRIDNPATIAITLAKTACDVVANVFAAFDPPPCVGMLLAELEDSVGVPVDGRDESAPVSFAAFSLKVAAV